MELARQRTTRRLWIAFGIVAGSAALAVMYLFDPETAGFFPVCQFHRMTGWYCPGCGCLRASHQLLHGHVAAALRLNAFYVMTLFGAGFVAVVRACERITSKLQLFRPRVGWIWPGVALLLIFTILRNLPCGAWLAPAG
ncbi:MAG TPA: DUF2752 domain-containing protein [Verrucomicrobiae bacterium]|nr:DUF2752 domain-containing protein [Verrucomicrobiae bacterium]